MAPQPDKILAWSDYHTESEHAQVEKTYKFFNKTVPDKPFTLLHYLQSHYYNFHLGAELPAPPTEEDPAPEEQIELFVSDGRWMWRCPRCHSGIIGERNADHPNHHNVTACMYCPFDQWRSQVFPSNWEAIEEELMRQPGYRRSAPIRNWYLGWTLEYLQERTAKAELLGPNPRALSIGLSHVWGIGERLTAAGMNLWISDLIDDLAGRYGPIEFENLVRTGGVGQLQLEPRTQEPAAWEGGISYERTDKSLRLDAGISGMGRELTVPAAIANDLVNGDVLVRDTSVEGGWLRLPTGGVGTVLTSRGPGLTPHWA